MTDPKKKERIRVLVADDQPHILEAVELAAEKPEAKAAQRVFARDGYLAPAP